MPGQKPSSQPTPLSTVAERVGILSPDLAEKVADDVLKLFRISLTATVVLTIALSAIDAIFIYSGSIEPSERLISERLLMTIIAASIVQVGAAMIAIVYAIFGRPKDVSADSARQSAENKIGGRGTPPTAPIKGPTEAAARTKATATPDVDPAAQS